MSTDEIRILIVDDEPDILEFLSYSLIREGYQVQTAVDGEAGYEKAMKFEPHLFILDIMMPKMNGVELCKKLRKRQKFDNAILAFLTAKSSAEAEIEGLDSGADDYITKPIKPKVFVSRVNALVRRFKTGRDATSLSNFGALSIDTEKFEVKVEGVPIALARKEFELLRLLASKPGKVFSRQEILSRVWGSDVIVVDRTVDVHIRKLRGKIGDGYIKTLKGVGYKFNF